MTLFSTPTQKEGLRWLNHPDIAMELFEETSFFLPPIVGASCQFFPPSKHGKWIQIGNASWLGASVSNIQTYPNYNHNRIEPPVTFRNTDLHNLHICPKNWASSVWLWALMRCANCSCRHPGEHFSAADALSLAHIVSAFLVSKRNTHNHNNIGYIEP